MNIVKTARALGWTSLAIAATEWFGRGTVEENLLGIQTHPNWMRALAAREAAAGAVLLSQHRVTPTLSAGLWSRVAGDAMDLALLAAALPRSRKPASLAANALIVLGITAMDVRCAWKVREELMESNGNRPSETADRPSTRMATAASGS